MILRSWVNRFMATVQARIWSRLTVLQCPVFDRYRAGKPYVLADQVVADSVFVAFEMSHATGSKRTVYRPSGYPPGQLVARQIAVLSETCSSASAVNTYRFIIRLSGWWRSSLYKRRY